MDQLYSDFIDLGAEAEERDEDFSEVSEWLDTNIQPIINWAKEHDAEEKVIAELRSDYFKLKEMMLEC